MHKQSKTQVRASPEKKITEINRKKVKLTSISRKKLHIFGGRREIHSLVALWVSLSLFEWVRNGEERREKIFMAFFESLSFTFLSSFANLEVH